MLRLLVPTSAHVVAFILLGLSGLLFYRIRSPLGLPLWPLKILAGSLAVFLAAGGALAAVLGLICRAPLAVAAGTGGAALAALYVHEVTVRPARLEQAPGGCRQGRAKPLPRTAARARPPRWERDVPFWTLAGTGRRLLCDIWQPPAGTTPSGVAIVFFHSSAWHLADKDVWTRPFFGHLAAEGHVVMDVAYRLCPEADIHGMLGDAKRAVAWMRANAARYGVDAGRIVAAGGSAGGHLALLAAYTPGCPDLTPEELQGVDTSVSAVVSYYGLADMRACYRNVQAILPDRARLARLAAGPLPRVTRAIAKALPGNLFARQLWKLEGMTEPGAMANLLGGQPCEVPAMYDLASPVTHVGPHCPPTLLIQGEHDAVVPAAATRALYRKLAQAGVRVVSLELPHTDHLFDLVLPQVSPAARIARREVDRFLAEACLLLADRQIEGGDEKACQGSPGGSRYPTAGTSATTSKGPPMAGLSCTATARPARAMTGTSLAARAWRRSCISGSSPPTGRA